MLYIYINGIENVARRSMALYVCHRVTPHGNNAIMNSTLPTPAALPPDPSVPSFAPLSISLSAPLILYLTITSSEFKFGVHLPSYHNHYSMMHCIPREGRTALSQLHKSHISSSSPAERGSFGIFFRMMPTTSDKRVRHIRLSERVAQYCYFTLPKAT